MDIKNIWVVITTINEPTIEILKYIKLSEAHGLNVLVVGDVITPEVYRDLNCSDPCFRFNFCARKRRLCKHDLRKNYSRRGLLDNS